MFKIFFKSYTEKLWGIKTSELDAEFAVQRIKKLSLVEAIIGALSTKIPIFQIFSKLLYNGAII